MITEFTPFKQQDAFIFDEQRITGAFAGKRGGKTEAGAVKFIKAMQEKKNYINNGRDPFLGALIAPTTDMLRRLSYKKFLSFSKGFYKGYNKSTFEMTWWDDSDIYGLSADKPERIEGIKASVIWLDEVFQMKEQVFLECRTRIADTKGILFCTGSLGVQIINPKLHWAYKYFKQAPDENTSVHEWGTEDNPYFPQDELESLKNTLDPVTFRAMYQLNWDVTPQSAVYESFNEDNILDNYTYNPNLSTYLCIDWGWAHPMAVGWFQYDERNDRVYLFDEICKSRLTLDKLWGEIKAKPYRIDGYYCDIAGNQEREQTGRSNIRWFKDKGISFKYRSAPGSVLKGISLVRRYVKNVKEISRFFIASQCKKSIDGMKRYRYAEKNGIIQNENPIKEDDDAVDMIRYFFWNRLDKEKRASQVRELRR